MGNSMISKFNRDWANAIIRSIESKNLFEVKSNMPYRESFVFEVVGMRLGLDDPLACSTNEYVFTTPCCVPMYSNGATEHYPELEKAAFEITSELLPEITKTINEINSLIGLSKYIEASA
jgi:hypothetical protein